MATYEDFLPEIRMQAYNVSDPVVEMYVRSAIIEFCETTRCWTRLVQEFIFKDDPRIYLTQVDDLQEKVEALVPSWYQGRQIIPDNPSQPGPYIVDIASLSVPENAQRGAPQRIFEIAGEDNVLGVWPVPDQQYNDLTFTVVLKPSRTATVYPDMFADDYRKAIITGALAEIFAVDGQSFSNPQKANQKMLEFQRFKLDAKVDAMRGRTLTGSLSVQSRPLIWGRNR